MATPATLTQMKQYLSTPDKPVDMQELKDFKVACSDAEWTEYKQQVGEILGL